MPRWLMYLIAVLVVLLIVILFVQHITVDVH